MIGRRGSLTRSEESRVRDYVAAFQREVRPDGGDDQALFHPRPGEGEIIVGPGSVRETEIKIPGGKDGAVPVVKLRYQVAEGGPVGLLLVHFERPA